MVTTRFQHLLWPQLGYLLFGTYLIIGFCTSISVRRHKSSTVHTAIHTGYADCLLASSQHNLYDIYLLLCVQC